MIALDASFLIATFELRDEHHWAAVQTLPIVLPSDLVASAVTIGETLVRPLATGRSQEIEERLDGLGIVRRAVPEDAGLRLAQLRVATGLKLPDCCVLLAAQDAGATAVASFDDPLRATADGRGLALVPRTL